MAAIIASILFLKGPKAARAAAGGVRSLHIARRAESGDGVAAELRALRRVATPLTDESNPRDSRDAGCSCEPVQHARHRQTRQPASTDVQAGCEMRRSMAQSPGCGRASPQRPHRDAPKGCQVMARPTRARG